MACKAKGVCHAKAASLSLRKTFYDSVSKPNLYALPALKLHKRGQTLLIIFATIFMSQALIE